MSLVPAIAPAAKPKGTNYSRAMWQARANRIAVWARWIAILLIWPEVMAAIALHFPLWDDIAIPVTFVVHQVAGFIQRHTEMYRIDY